MAGTPYQIILHSAHVNIFWELSDGLISVRQRKCWHVCCLKSRSYCSEKKQTTIQAEFLNSMIYVPRGEKRPEHRETNNNQCKQNSISSSSLLKIACLHITCICLMIPTMMSTMSLSHKYLCQPPKAAKLRTANKKACARIRRVFL